MEARADVQRRYQDALEALVADLEQDYYVLAAFVYGSVARGEEWERSDVDLAIVMRDGLERLEPYRWLDKDGINVSANLVPRSEFKRSMDGALQGSILHAIRSHAKLLFCKDEPTIGLHPHDNQRMISTLRKLRDIGNSVVVVEHDEETIRAADHIIELGPGPGADGGEVVAQGTLDDILCNPRSLTGQYLQGTLEIPIPKARRSPNGKNLVILGAQENNLRDIRVVIPLGVFTCVTGVSGAGKSSLIHEILYKGLYSVFHDSRVLPGKHRRIEGIDQISDVIHIDQAPIGRSPRSTPATYIGVHDRIRRLFAQTPDAQARGFKASRFSFNVKEGRCEECGGEGFVRTRLQFMADVESPCLVCKGHAITQRRSRSNTRTRASPTCSTCRSRKGLSSLLISVPSPTSCAR